MLVKSYGTNFTVAPEMYTRAAEALADYPASLALSRGFRLDTVAQPAVGKRVRFCTPGLTNAHELTGLMRQAMRSSPDLVPFAGYRANVLLRIYAPREGNAVFPEIVRSSGVSRLDDLAMQVAVQARFAPATIDGVPVDVYVTLPMGFIAQGNPEWDPTGVQDPPAGRP